ncbi:MULTISPECIES: NAD(+) diphosphatase [Sphingomonas]|uniref:NAD(+) diphosphatase n=1 Tax=Sphingomonas lycopersici TaxID=2951807 RepID=A0AA41ZBE8_9SPHN|nr:MULTISPECIES: NAD(+) diphosphatase [Sphingomonas]MCW6531845.1 NAD(+) diphosphatase [Sphingomonas lycopersici]MCW6537397.1 NAD(+) diphosphatase [Sphingomonas lycopersici]OJU23036.1 MAG: NADH pyrophosphatase [Sphingomonas sp. 66-10]
MNVPGFTGGMLDRADRLRHDEEALAAAIGNWQARLLKLHAWEPEVTDDGRLGWTMLSEASEEAEFILLGLDEGRPRFAAFEPAVGAAPAAFRSPTLLAALDQLQMGEAATFAAARSVLDWHARHRFCANCGTPTTMFRAGWARRCGNCGAEHFPRVDPVVIMIAEHDGRALLGRQPSWPAGRYSALAGFVEPGESIEEAVRREIAEEAGVRVGAVRYVASQPWPFPSQLMIACVGIAEGDALTIDTNELETAGWFTRDEVRDVLAGKEGPFLAPPPYAIAHTLLTEWARG